MKICRFQPLTLGAGPEKLGEQTEFQPASRSGVIEDAQILEVRDVFHANERIGQTWALSETKLLPPSVPSKIVCVGRNYAEHAAEMGNTAPKEPLIFLKPPSAIIAPEEPIVLTPLSERVDYEGELAVVIGRPCSRLRPSDPVQPYILGYTCLNDVTARDLQKKDVQFTRAKGFDTFCPFGPVIETELDLAAVTLETKVNGKKRQSVHVGEMIFSVDVIIRWISQVMTLLPGDVISTGTPSGVGPLAEGDVVEVIVTGIGILRNPVAAAGSEHDIQRKGGN
jgi:2-keto-4-pentenoate hydratase/2-oxohepta-3-ene-1,7-dioic acid hydratase in catechol pathway